METIEEKIQRLPKELQREVLDFVDFLLDKYSDKNQKTSPVDKSELNNVEPFKYFLLNCPKISDDFEFERKKDKPRDIEF